MSEDVPRPRSRSSSIGRGIAPSLGGSAVMVVTERPEPTLAEEEEYSTLIPYTPKHCCSPGRKSYRTLVLVSICLLTVGSYFAYDAVGALKTDIKKNLHISNFQFSMLYAIYSLPNTVMVFVGGLFMDRVGNRFASLIFSSLVVLGAATVAVGPMMGKFWIMLLGRFIFGIGAESLCACQDSMVNRWFRDSGFIALAYGMLVTVSRLGTLGTFNAEVRVADYTGSYIWALWFAVVLCVVGYLFNILYVILDRHAEKPLRLPAIEESEPIKLKDVKTFPKTYIIVAVLCTLFYAAVMPFTANATDFFVKKYHKTEVEAGFITSIVIMSSIVLSPVFGSILDKKGKRSLAVMIGTGLLIPTHIIMGLTDIDPIYPMCLLGASFSMVPSALWPSVSILINPRQVGTAFGLIYSIQNFGLFTINLLVGYLIDEIGYSRTMIFFFILDVTAFIFGTMLFIVDMSTGKRLHKVQVEKWEKAEDKVEAPKTDEEKNGIINHE